VVVTVKIGLMRENQWLWAWLAIGIGVVGGVATFAWKVGFKVWPIVVVLIALLASLGVAYGLNLLVIGLPAIRAGAPHRQVLKSMSAPTAIGFFGAPSGVRFGIVSGFMLVGAVNGIARAGDVLHQVSPWDLTALLFSFVMWGSLVALGTRRLLSKRLPGRRGTIIAIRAGVLSATYWLLVGLGVGL
jgi:hypothetical protein